MFANPSTQDNAKSFDYNEEKCLYRDHFGRRVLADVEGSGHYRVERSETAVTVLRDESPSTKFHGEFQNGLLVLAENPGEVSVLVGVGGLPLATGGLVEVDLPYLGSGWVVDADGPISIDHRQEPAPRPADGFPIPFLWEVGGVGRARIMISSSRTQAIDSFDIGDSEALRARQFSVQNMSKLSALDSRFADETPRRAEVASHLNAASWRVVLAEGAQELRVRKFYDRFHGRQRARVLIDGRHAGWWYEPGEDRAKRWGVSDFGVSSDLIAGKSEFEIRVDPPAGSPLWSVSRIEIFALFTRVVGDFDSRLS